MLPFNSLSRQSGNYVRPFTGFWLLGNMTDLNSIYMLYSYAVKYLSEIQSSM